MAPTSNQIKRVRRMTEESDFTSPYSDEEISDIISEAAIMDSNGKMPIDPDWIETYDLYDAASRIWLEKAAKVAKEFDFSSDGGNFSRSQKQAQYLKQAAMFAGRSTAKSGRYVKVPPTNVIGFEDTYYKDWLDDYENRLV